jgi:carbonic anhydrase
MKAMLPILEQTVEMLESHHQKSLIEREAMNGLAQIQASPNSSVPSKEWSYQLWGQDYPLCAGTPTPIYGIEHNEWQSPIDIIDNEEASPPFSNLDAASFSTDSSHTTAHFGKNGHTFEVGFLVENKTSSTDGLWIDYEGVAYDLQSFHFTASSENTLNGIHYPAEMQLVHRERNGDAQLVVSIWLLPAVGQPQGLTSAEYLRGIFSHGFNDENVQTGSDLNPYTAMNLEGQEFYSFVGSKSTPPCTPGVRWLVKQTPEQIGAEELMAFKTYLLGEDEVRCCDIVIDGRHC